MDIMGLPKRMLNQFSQLNSPATITATQATADTKEKVSLDSLSSMSERINHIASEFDVKALPISEIASLQTSLKCEHRAYLLSWPIATMKQAL